MRCRCRVIVCAAWSVRVVCGRRVRRVRAVRCRVCTWGVRVFNVLHSTGAMVGMSGMWRSLRGVPYEKSMKKHFVYLRSRAAFLLRCWAGALSPRPAEYVRSAVSEVRVSRGRVRKAERRGIGVADAEDALSSLLHRSERAAAAGLCEHIRGHVRDYISFEVRGDGAGGYIVRAVIRVVK